MVEFGDTEMFGPDLVYQALDKVNVIRYRLKVARSHKKFYEDVRRRKSEFEVGDKVFLKVSPSKGVIQNGKK